MGNHYRGGVFQNFWLSWYHAAGYKYKPSFPAGLSHEQMIRLNRYWSPQPAVDSAGELRQRHQYPAAE
jgi:hypothetical protein